jgi:hypothetical protein
MNIAGLAKSAKAETKFSIEYIKNSKKFGLKESWLYETFTDHNGIMYTLLGLNKRGAYFIVGTTNPLDPLDAKSYKFFSINSIKHQFS